MSHIPCSKITVLQVGSRQRPTPPMAGTNEETTINLKPIDCRNKFPPILPAPICLIFRYASHEFAVGSAPPRVAGTNEENNTCQDVNYLLILLFVFFACPKKTNQKKGHPCHLVLRTALRLCPSGCSSKLPEIYKLAKFMPQRGAQTV